MVQLSRRSDLSALPDISLSIGDVTGLLVFTYLLSRGIGDTIEGINKLRIIHSDGVLRWFRS